MSTALTANPRDLVLSGPIGSLDAYVGTVNAIPVLSREDELALARDYRDHENLEAARQLVMSQLRFVVHIARSYNGYGLPLGDLVQEGNVGLMKAVKRFDPEVGVRLVSFAVHWIRAEIHEYVLRNWRLVKIATTKAQRKLFFNLRKSRNISAGYPRQKPTLSPVTWVSALVKSPKWKNVCPDRTSLSIRHRVTMKKRPTHRLITCRAAPLIRLN